MTGHAVRRRDREVHTLQSQSPMSLALLATTDFRTNGERIFGIGPSAIRLDSPALSFAIKGQWGCCASKTPHWNRHSHKKKDAELILRIYLQRNPDKLVRLTATLDGC